MQRTVAAILLLLGWSTTSPTAAQCPTPTPQATVTPYDSLHVTPGDFRNIRGFNYVAVYPSLNHPSSAHYGAPSTWRGVASPSAMWEHYRPKGRTAREVHEQLRIMRSVGVNTVRVFMSFPSWLHYHRRAEATGKPNDYCRRFRDFLERCRANGIRCVPVLWDNTGVGAANQPEYDGPHSYYQDAIFHAWHANPGVKQFRRMLANGGGTFAGTLAERYIRDLVEASRNTTAIAMWEIINEPFQMAEPLLGDVIRGTVQVLDPLTPKPILLGLLWSDHAMHDYARMPEIDVLAIHHYALFSTRAALQSQVHNATHIRQSAGQTTAAPILAKPVVLGEGGASGSGHHYADAFEQALTVPRDDIGPGATGVGFMSFAAMVGWQHGNYPFKDQAGVFYGDGTVRDLDVIYALLAAAGLPPTTSLVKKVDPTPPPCPNNATAYADNPICSGYVAQAPITRDLDQYAERVAWMNASVTDFMNVGVNPGCPPDFTAYVRLRQMFRLAYESVTAAHDIALIWTGTQNAVTPVGSPNGNPYASASTAPPFFVVPLAIQLNVEAWFAATEVRTDANDQFVPTPFTNNILANSGVGTVFDPRVHPEHLAMLCADTFEPLRVTIRDYVIAQQ